MQLGPLSLHFRADAGVGNGGVAGGTSGAVDGIGGNGGAAGGTSGAVGGIGGNYAYLFYTLIFKLKPIS